MLIKDTSNRGKNAIYTCLGASNHVAFDRQSEDLYSTDPIAAELLLEALPELKDMGKQVWENSCGLLHLADVFDKYGLLAKCSDILNRTNDPRVEIIDFLQINSGNGLLKPEEKYPYSIIMNPPYKSALAFVKKSLEILEEGRWVCAFLKLTFLEGKERKPFFLKFPPRYLFVSSSRIACAMNGEFYKPKLDKKGNQVLGADGKPIMEKVQSAVAYGWYCWKVGDYSHHTEIQWIN